ncbi:beta-hydroxyacyl-ACP dehydratase [Curvibacter sp. CHRR-16]|uniref:ApeP family dehydratase n=1 Tax=Curvibacter sp. CHRR-16 TaxID=2835872 RepID=UPI001BDA1ABA|nr:beta-hydroxyacyl-ACP dehydratase [Curvibacter sp. CHRR-16]MBT0568756.1 beta-hydroxyacyl-ACP dehydratase [Curvibacter sp. CHRR-16]
MRVEDLLPHRGTLLLLDRLVQVDAHHALAMVDVSSPERANAWYQDQQNQQDQPGTMPAWIGIELMAQAIALHVGWVKAQQQLPPQMGVLLGTRSYRSRVPSFSGVLQVRAELEFLDTSGLGAYSCSILQQGQVLVEASIKVYEPDDFQAFLAQHSNSPA